MSTFVTRPAVEDLRARIRRLEGAAGRRRLVLPFGIKALDRHLPGGGLALGALHEMAGGGNGTIHGSAAALFAGGSQHVRGERSYGASRAPTFLPRPSRKPGSWPIA